LCRVAGGSVVITENGVKLRLNIVDTPGYGDLINNEGWWVLLPNSPIPISLFLGLKWLLTELLIFLHLAGTQSSNTFVPFPLPPLLPLVPGSLSVTRYVEFADPTEPLTCVFAVSHIRSRTSTPPTSERS
jgi:hypothetical protein